MEDNKNYLHWRNYMKMPYLGAWSLQPKEEKVLTIKGIAQERVTAPGGSSEMCAVLHFKEDVLPMVLNTTNCRTIEKIYGTPNVLEWVGKKIQIYAATTKFGRDQVPCLRIRPFAPQTNEVVYKCSVCGKVIDKHTHDASIEKYGKPYCSGECKKIDIEGKDIL